jgi:isoleucyl-tRNA synthetase
VLYETAHALIRMLAPILVHTAEEAWSALRGDDEQAEGSVHLERLPAAPDVAVDDGWQRVMALRSEVLKQLELAKEEGLSNPLDAGVELVADAEEGANLEPFAAELADLFGVSRFAIDEGAGRKIRVVDLREEPRCERCWKRDGTVRERSDGGMLSDRDAAVVGVE